MNDSKNKVGRPVAVTPSIIAKLEEAFSYGASDLEACMIADISSSTLYNYQQKHPEFMERKAKLKDMPKYQARLNIVDALNKGDKEMSKWYAERKIKEEFSARQETTGKDGGALEVKVNPLTELLQEIDGKTKSK